MIPTSWLTAECLAAAAGSPPRARSIQLFRNGLVDRWLARAHPAFPALFFGPVAAAALATSWRLLGPAEALAAFLGGWLFFSLFEYALHRFVFHGNFPETTEGRVAWFLTHGYHHVYPNDADRLVLPPIGSLPLAALFVAAYLLALGPGLGLGAFAGTVVGYILYELGALRPAPPPAAHRLGRLAAALPHAAPPHPRALALRRELAALGPRVPDLRAGQAGGPRHPFSDRRRPRPLVTPKPPANDNSRTVERDARCR